MGNSQCIQEPEEDTAHNDISYDFFANLAKSIKAMKITMMLVMPYPPSPPSVSIILASLKLFTILDGACQSHSVSIADVSAGRDAAADTGDFDAGRFDEP